jgi:hypothetical protein
MATLEELQRYYTYGEGGWQHKATPYLDKAVVKELLRIGGVDAYGDPLWRFCWGGVVTVRHDPKSPTPEAILGPREGVRTTYGRVTPRHLHGRIARPRRWLYLDRKGRAREVKRPDAAPKGKRVWREDEFLEFGKLRWYVERKLTPEQLVEVGARAEDDPDIPANGDYFALLTVETDEGLYFEPTRAYLDAIRKHIHEEENESLVDLLLQARARDELREHNEKAQEWDEVMTLVEDILTNPDRETEVIRPRALPPRPVFTGDILR